MSQSTIENRNGSNACVFIAFNFGLLYKQFSLDNTLVGQNLNSHWQTALEHAIRAGNDIHDQLFDFEGVNVSVEEKIELAGGLCQVGQVLREYALCKRTRAAFPKILDTNPYSFEKRMYGAISGK